ncbi:uncharacterized protein LOC127240829 isoform X2 [Andrographis paniculata]|nr:uncharacterized protein LOC127240829 isoform X2 [Andrographis paniculata]
MTKEKVPVKYTRRNRRQPKMCEPSPSTLEYGDDDDREKKKTRLAGDLVQPDREISETKKKLSDQQRGADSTGRKAGGKRKKCTTIVVDCRSDDVAATEKKKEKKQKGVIVSEETTKADSCKTNSVETKCGPIPTPLPDKKLLTGILSKLQELDVYGAFSNPVDIIDVPDYYDVVKQPMDFPTIRKKLRKSCYKSLEDLEADVQLLCSNAMLFNGPDTVYHKQGLAIQNLANEEFGKLKNPEGKDAVLDKDNDKKKEKAQEVELQLQQAVQERRIRGKAPENNESIDRSPALAVAPTEDHQGTSSGRYNLTKGPELSYSYRKEQSDSTSHTLAYSWNQEFPVSVVRADAKQGRRNTAVDLNRRGTYNQPCPHSSPPTSLTNLAKEPHHLVPISSGSLRDPLCYARSLAQFAADLGPVAWKIASKKIEAALPIGTAYGPGWVGEPIPATPRSQLASSSSQPN